MFVFALLEAIFALFPKLSIKYAELSSYVTIEFSSTTSFLSTTNLIFA